MTELELIERARKGDQRAFAILYRENEPRVSRQLMSRYLAGSGWHNLEDVVQEVFIKAFRNLHQFRGESMFSTWLYRIAENTAKNHLARAQVQFVTGEAADRELANLAYVDESEEMLEREAKISATTDAVYRTAAKLHPGLAEALILREVEHLSCADIAERLGCAAGTVRSRLFRAREALKAELEAQR